MSERSGESAGGARRASPGAHGGLRTFYAWVQSTRGQVFAYLDAVPEETLRLRHPAFRGSMLELMSHAADCYLHWTGHVGLGLDPVPEARPAGLDDVRQHFALVDDVMVRALEQRARLDAPVDWQGHRLTLRYLILHPITHEFHHKGQVASLGRLHGHPVPEGTDLDLALPG